MCPKKRKNIEKNDKQHDNESRERNYKAVFLAVDLQQRFLGSPVDIRIQLQSCQLCAIHMKDLRATCTWQAHSLSFLAHIACLNIRRRKKEVSCFRKEHLKKKSIAKEITCFHRFLGILPAFSTGSRAAESPNLTSGIHIAQMTCAQLFSIVRVIACGASLAACDRPRRFGWSEFSTLGTNLFWGQKMQW